MVDKQHLRSLLQAWHQAKLNLDHHAARLEGEVITGFGLGGDIETLTRAWWDARADLAWAERDLERFLAGWIIEREQTDANAPTPESEEPASAP
jgi:hypothetical protein